MSYFSLSTNSSTALMWSRGLWWRKFQYGFWSPLWQLYCRSSTSCGCCCCFPVTWSCLTFCVSMVCSTPGFPVLHHLPELIQTHVHWAGDTIQPSHPLLSSSFLPSIFPIIRVFSNLASGGPCIEASTSVLPMNIQDWFPLGLTGLIFLQAKGLSGVFSNTTIQKY